MEIELELPQNSRGGGIRHSTDLETDRPFPPCAPARFSKLGLWKLFHQAPELGLDGLSVRDWELAAGRGGTSRFEVAAAHPELPLVRACLSHSPLDIVHH